MEVTNLTELEEATTALVDQMQTVDEMLYNFVRQGSFTDEQISEHCAELFNNDCESDHHGHSKGYDR